MSEELDEVFNLPDAHVPGSVEGLFTDAVPDLGEEIDQTAEVDAWLASPEGQYHDGIDEAAVAGEV